MGTLAQVMEYVKGTRVVEMKVESKAGMLAAAMAVVMVLFWALNLVVKLAAFAVEMKDLLLID